MTEEIRTAEEYLAGCFAGALAACLQDDPGRYFEPYAGVKVHLRELAKEMALVVAEEGRRPREQARYIKGSHPLFIVLDETAGWKPECTGLSASWCPLHGSCTCPADGDGERRHLDDDGCPLHAWDSEHAPAEAATLQRDADEIIRELSRTTPPAGSRWPYTTPTGHTYAEPETIEDLRQRSTDKGQAEIEQWDPAEHPPEPTWEMVALALREVSRLTRELTRTEQALGQEVEIHERYHELLDRFAYAVAPQSQIGEHSNLNSPWINALEILESRRVIADGDVGSQG